MMEETTMAATMLATTMAADQGRSPFPPSLPGDQNDVTADTDQA